MAYSSKSCTNTASFATIWTAHGPLQVVVVAVAAIVFFGILPQQTRIPGWMAQDAEHLRSTAENPSVVSN